MRILFIGDMVGRSGRNIVLERLPGLIADWKLDLVVDQRRERRRRLRHHRGDLQRTDRRRRRRDHARQSRLGPARGAGVHRARAAADPPAQLSARHARARRGADRRQERRARAGHQRDGPHLHGPARRSVRRDRARALGLRAEKRRRRHHHRHPLRGDQREAGDGLFRRRPRQPRGRHPHPCADRRPSHPARRHGLRLRCRHDRRLRLRHRHGEGRAARPLPAANSAASSSRRTAPARCAGSRSRPTTQPGLRGGSAPVRLGGMLEEARPAFWG